MGCATDVKYKEDECAVIRWVDEFYEVYEDQIILEQLNILKDFLVCWILIPWFHPGFFILADPASLASQIVS